MAKINFTQEHFERLKTYAVEMLFTRETVTTKLGQTLNIVELLHTTTINTLNSIRLQLGKEIETIENQDEWVSGNTSQRKLENLKAELSQYTNDVLTIVCDVSDENAVTESTEKVMTAFGKVDILVNNAAVWRIWKPFSDISTEEWKKFFDINVFGLVYMTKAVLSGMLERKYGRVINIASVAGVYGNANMVNYSASKGAVISMSKALAKETTPNGVTVNSVSPGSVSPSENADIDHSISGILPVGCCYRHGCFQQR